MAHFFSIRFGAGLAGLMGLLLASAAARSFDFNPPAGPITRTLEAVTENNVNGETLGGSSYRTVRELIFYPLDEGWRMSSRSREVELATLKDDLASDIQRILLEQNYSILFNAAGGVRAVEGFDTLAQAIDKKIPATEQEVVSRVLNAESQQWRLATHWQQRIGWLASQPFLDKLPHTVERKETLNPPDGPAMEWQAQTTFRAKKSTAKGPAVLIETSSEARSSQSSGGIRISTEEQRLMLLESMLPLTEHITKTVEVNLPGAEGSPALKQVRRESIEITYAY